MSDGWSDSVVGERNPLLTVRLGGAIVEGACDARVTRTLRARGHHIMGEHVEAATAYIRKGFGCPEAGLGTIEVDGRLVYSGLVMFQHKWR